LTYGAVILLLVLAVDTGHIGRNLCANAHPVANLDVFDILADLHSTSNDLMT
jgi:hypothetical protein